MTAAKRKTVGLEDETAMADSIQPLIGAWRLDQWRLSIDGRWRDPYLGAGASGAIIYSADGWMSAILMAAERPLLGPAGFVLADAGKKFRAADGYVSYAGRFELEGADVCHHVELSLYPDWIGQTLRRRVSWDEMGRLTLTTPAVTTSRGKVVFDEITWRKNRNDQDPVVVNLVI